MCLQMANWILENPCAQALPKSLAQFFGATTGVFKQRQFQSHELHEILSPITAIHLLFYMIQSPSPRRFSPQAGSSVFQGSRPHATWNPPLWVSRNWRATRTWTSGLLMVFQHSYWKMANLQMIYDSLPSQNGWCVIFPIGNPLLRESMIFFSFGWDIWSKSKWEKFAASIKREGIALFIFVRETGIYTFFQGR